MTDKTNLIREIHEYVTAHGGENTATHLLVQAASAIQTQAAELEAVGAGGVSGPMMGQPQAMPDLSALTERGATAWAGVDAQGLRDGVASAGSEPVAWQYRSVRDKGLWFDCTEERAKQRAAHPETWDVRYLYTHPSPPEGMVGGWIALPGALPEPGVPVLLDIGKKYPIRALWAAKHTVQACDDDTDWGEYVEEDDMYYAPEGWYEWNQCEDNHWRVTETPRAWMPLPPASAEGVEHG